MTAAIIVPFETLNSTDDIGNKSASTALLSARKDYLTLTVFAAMATPMPQAGQYARLAARTLAAHSAMLRHFDFGDILTSDALCAFVHRDEHLLAAAYARPAMRGERRVLVHKGYVSTGEERGTAKMMIAGLHLADARLAGAASDGEAVARVLLSGEINQASSTPFADVGFHGVRNYWDRIGNGDVHLEPFAEQRLDGHWVGCHLMAGKAEKIAARASEVLSGWKLI